MKLMLVVLTLLAAAALGAWTAKAQCPVTLGVGVNFNCMTGSSCDNYGTYCTYEQCACNGTCNQCFFYPEAIECNWLACYNPFTGNCKSCSS